MKPVKVKKKVRRCQLKEPSWATILRKAAAVAGGRWQGKEELPSVGEMG